MFLQENAFEKKTFSQNVLAAFQRCVATRAFELCDLKRSISAVRRKVQERTLKNVSCTYDIDEVDSQTKF
jgi:hypothetical protein